MASIANGYLKLWKDGEKVTGTDLTKLQEVLRVAINDNDDRIDFLETNATNQRLADNFALPNDGSTKYPLGLSVFRAIESADWGEIASSDVFVLTNKSSDNEAVQFVLAIGATAKVWFRQTNSAAWQALTELTLGAHLSEADPHPQYATDADLTVHKEATDPHPQYNFVVEQGTNSNGTYRKYADGTMECWHTWVSQSSTGWSVNGGYYFVSQAWTFPAAFKSGTQPAVFSDGDISGYYGLENVKAYHRDHTYCQVEIGATSSSVQGMGWSRSFYAKGVWK